MSITNIVIIFQINNQIFETLINELMQILDISFFEQMFLIDNKKKDYVFNILKNNFFFKNCENKSISFVNSKTKNNLFECLIALNICIFFYIIKNTIN